MKSKKLKTIIGFALAFSMVSEILPIKVNAIDNVIEVSQEVVGVNNSITYKTYDNLSVNSGFEELTDKKDGIWVGDKYPVGWKATKFGSASYKAVEVSLDDTVKKEGNYSLKLNVTQDNSRSFVTQTFNVKPNTTYELASDIKVQSLAPMMFGIQVFEVANGSNVDTDANRTTLIRVDGSKDWNTYKHVLRTGKNTTQVTLRINMGTNQGVKKGSTAWVDNLTFKEVSIPVEGIRLSTNNITAMEGTSHSLRATVLPESATNQNVTWISSDENIASVDDNGNVTLNNVGSAEITAKTEEGGFKSTCKVEVIENKPIESITLDENVELELGSSVKLKPVIKPNISGLNLKWTSSNESIVTVDENGVVTPKKKGEAVVKVEIQGKSAEAKVKVVEAMNSMLPNPGFENGADGVPKGYKFDVTNGKGSISFEREDAFRGEQAVRIDLQEKSEAKLTTLERKNLSDGIYSISVWAKYKDFEGEGIKFEVNQNKADDVYILSTSDVFEGSNGDKYQKIEFIYDATHGTRNIALDIKINGKGTVLLDDLKFVKLNMPTEIKLDKEVSLDISNGAKEYKLNPEITPVSNLTDTRLMWESSDSKVVKVSEDGTLMPKKAGKAIVTAMTLNGKKKGSINVEVTGVLPESEIVDVSNIKLQENFTVEAGKAIKLNPVIEPVNATNTDLEWISSNNDIATVKDGRVYTKSEGKVVITAKSNNGKEAETTINVVKNVNDKFEVTLEEWGKKAYHAKVDTAKTVWNDMKKDENRLYLWDGIEDLRISSNVKKSVDNLKLLARAATSPENDLYQNEDLINDIIDGLMFICENKYNENVLQNFKFWDWEIGIPKDIGDIISMMYPYMNTEELEKPSKFITEVVKPDVMESRAATVGATRAMTGANLVDSVKGVFVPHLVLKQEDKINYAIASMLTTLNTVSEGDGFYKDGSFIQHDNISYTGSYGVELLKGISGLIDNLGLTEFNISNNPEISKLYDIIDKAYIPLIYNGALMDMTRGRAISRPGNTDHSNGHVILDCLIIIGNSSPEPHKTEILSRAKRILLDDINHLDKITDPARRKRAMDLLKDKSIKIADKLIMSKEYASMNRTVHHAENFGFGISKSSKRIANYELINGENKKGWHTGDGMTYLYNSDSNQFTDHFWATVDYMRLPGTTVDTGKRYYDHAQYGDGEGTPNNSWAGGTTIDGKYGASGMNLQSKRKEGTTLTANKSWFMFDDEVIALGSNIDSTDGRDIESIVEQRMINGDNEFIVNGIVKSKELGYSESIKEASWAYLEGNDENSSIGYYFPEKQEINVLREERTGNYKDVNNGQDASYTRNFLTMYFNHGKSPEDAKYSYSILPGKTPTEVEEYSKNPDYEVLSNTNEIHAVRENKLNILAANFFEDGIQTIDGLTVDKKASVMVKNNGDNLEISVSDPTLENEGNINIELDQKVLGTLEVDDRVEVVEAGEKVRLTVNVNDSAGETVTAKFKLKEEKPEKPEEKPEVKPEEKPDGDGSITDSTNKDEVVPETGDKTPLYMVIMSMFMAAVAMVYTRKNKKRT